MARSTGRVASTASSPVAAPGFAGGLVNLRREAMRTRVSSRRGEGQRSPVFARSGTGRPARARGVRLSELLVTSQVVDSALNCARLS